MIIVGLLHRFFFVLGSSGFAVSFRGGSHPGFVPSRRRPHSAFPVAHARASRRNRNAADFRYPFVCDCEEQ